MSREGNPYFGATFAERKAARLGTSPKPSTKAVDAETDGVEDKAVKKAATKAPRKTAVKKG